MAKRVKSINTRILKQCRKQIGLSVDDVVKKIPKILDIEEGILNPTFKQLEILSVLYKVPRWVFISEELPKKYVFKSSVPAFRQFSESKSDVFSHASIRGLVTKIERYRELLIDLLNDLDEEIRIFDPPNIKGKSIYDISKAVSHWLEISNRKLTFNQLKQLLEEKGIFIFLTSKYKGWSHIDKSIFRGLAIYHEKYPIIIVNDSDSRKAQSFTLLHELAHLLRMESSLDNWEYMNSKIEYWCDELAGNILMPLNEFQDIGNIDNIESIKELANRFKVSNYACLVRLRQLNLISVSRYHNLKEDMTEEYRIYLNNLRNLRGISRNRPKEILNQYGHLFSRTIYSAYHNGNIGLSKISSILEIKRSSYLFEIEDLL